MTERSLIVRFNVIEGDPDAVAEEVRSLFAGRLSDDGGADVAMILDDEVAEQVTDWDVIPVVPTTGKRRLTDEEALDRMATLFSASEWPGSSGLEDLCSIVKRTGRSITDDPTIEWGRH
jgi:hypothetical protein